MESKTIVDIIVSNIAEVVGSEIGIDIISSVIRKVGIDANCVGDTLLVEVIESKTVNCIDVDDSDKVDTSIVDVIGSKKIVDIIKSRSEEVVGSRIDAEVIVS